MTKKKNYLFVLILFISIVGTMYYFRTISATDVFPKLDNAQKITFAVRFHEKEELEFINAEIKGNKMEYFIDLLEMTRYRRAFGRTNIQSQRNAYDIALFHDSSNYSIVINNKGYVVVDEMGKKKKYKILSSKNDTLIKLINEMLKST